MYCVIRNGQYLETTKKLFDDIEVPAKPHEKAEFINGEWVLNADLLFSENDYEIKKSTPHHLSILLILGMI